MSQADLKTPCNGLELFDEHIRMCTAENEEKGEVAPIKKNEEYVVLKLRRVGDVVKSEPMSNAQEAPKAASYNPIVLGF